MYQPVIVTGTGRCGSSTVARWLHEDLVVMGERFSLEKNPGLEPGFWEDLDFCAINRAALLDEDSVYQFKMKLESIIQAKRAALRPWGFKDPRTSDPKLLPAYVSYFPKALWVVCERELGACVASYKRQHPLQTDAEVLEVVAARKASIDEHLSGLHVLRVPFETIVDGTAKAKVLEAATQHVRRGTNKTPNVYVSVPNLDWIHYSVAISLLKLRRDQRINVRTVFSNWRPYENNLHHCIKDFLAGDWDYWINMDADNACKRNPADLIWLDKDIIGLPTPIWAPGDDGRCPIHLNVGTAKDGGMKVQPWAGPLDQGLQKVSATGSGGLVIARRVLERLEAPFLRIYDDEGIAQLGCDYAFSKRAQEAGFEIWAHFSYACTHYKELEIVSVFDAAYDVLHPKGKHFAGATQDIGSPEQNSMQGEHHEHVGQAHHVD